MKTLALVLLATFTSVSAGAAVNLKSPGSEGSVSFLAVGKPSMLKIHGKAEGPQAKITVADSKMNGTADFSMEKLSTGIEMRDKHMKEKYLETASNPKATLTLKNTKVDSDFEKTLSNAGELPFEGTLKLHGKEQPVKGTYTAKNGKVDAKFQIKLTDYGIEIPTYLGATVAENVDVQVNLPLQKE